MAFLSTFENTLDDKGRVSVPAPFRAELPGEKGKRLFLYQSLKYPCIEGSGQDRMTQLVESIDRLPVYSDEREDFETLLSDACYVNVDNDGRIIIPQKLITIAGLRLKEKVTFAGIGRSFRIWDPGVYAEHQKQRRQQASARGATLSLYHPRQEAER